MFPLTGLICRGTKTMFGTIKDFTADRFAPTQWEGADKKANFARQFIRFVQSDFAQDKFCNTFYVRLSLTFSHIAHFNKAGFYETFFTTTTDKVRFLRMTLRHECYGDPGYTYSDVERALQSWLHQHGILAKYEQRLANEVEMAERAELARLQAKYAN